MPALLRNYIIYSMAPGTLHTLTVWSLHAFSVLFFTMLPPTLLNSYIFYRSLNTSWSLTLPCLFHYVVIILECVFQPTLHGKLNSNSYSFLKVFSSENPSGISWPFSALSYFTSQLTFPTWWLSCLYVHTPCGLSLLGMGNSSGNKNNHG